jgi:hypothetical protein
MSEREDLVSRVGAIDAAVARAREELAKALTERKELVDRLGALGLTDRGAPLGSPSPTATATEALPTAGTSPSTPPSSPAPSPEVPSNATDLVHPSVIMPGFHPMLRLAGTWEPHLVWSGGQEPPQVVQVAICGVRDDPRNWRYPSPPYGDPIEVHTACLQRMRTSRPPA